MEYHDVSTQVDSILPLNIRLGRKSLTETQDYFSMELIKAVNDFAVQALSNQLFVKNVTLIKHNWYYTVFQNLMKSNG